MVHILISIWYLRFSWVRREVLPLWRPEQHELYGYSLDVFPSMSILGLLNDETPYPRPLSEVHLDPVIWTMRVATPPSLVSFTCHGMKWIYFLWMNSRQINIEKMKKKSSFQRIRISIKINFMIICWLSKTKIYTFSWKIKLERNLSTCSQNEMSRKRLGITWTTIQSSVHYLPSWRVWGFDHRLGDAIP